MTFIDLLLWAVRIVSRESVRLLPMESRASPQQFLPSGWAPNPDVERWRLRQFRTSEGHRRDDSAASGRADQPTSGREDFAFHSGKRPRAFDTLLRRAQS